MRSTEQSVGIKVEVFVPNIIKIRESGMRMRPEFYAKHRGSRDTVLFVLVCILTAFGLVMLASTSAWNGYVKFRDAGYYVKKQLFATSLGLAAMVAVSRLDYRLLRFLAVPAYGLSLVLSSLVLVVGREYNGSKRWLALGPLSFQPAEFAKVAVILLLAWAVDRKKGRMEKMRSLISVLLLLLPIVALVGTNNLSTAVIILGIGFLLIFLSTPRYVPFVFMGAAGAGLVAVFLGMESYRLERLMIWRHPENYEKGYQTIQGLYAIGSGGVFGQGLGSSMQKLGFVPEAQNDMIFSIICEELGLVGALALILLFSLMIWRFMVIAMHAEDLFGALLAAGIMGHIAIQVILNIAVVTNSIPNTGITLPFVSYGGTSVCFLLAEMGIALSVSARTKL